MKRFISFRQDINQFIWGGIIRSASQSYRTCSRAADLDTESSLQTRPEIRNFLFLLGNQIEFSLDRQNEAKLCILRIVSGFLNRLKTVSRGIRDIAIFLLSSLLL